MKKKKAIVPSDIKNADPLEGIEEELESLSDAEAYNENSLVGPEALTNHMESILEKFGDGDPRLREDGAIVDARGNVIIRP